MARGGARAGAGRPKGGVSELSRILQEGGVDGLADIGAELGASGDRAEMAQAAVRAIVRDWAKADPASVMRFFASIAPSKREEEGGESALIAALKRAPGLLPDSAESLPATSYSVEPAKPGDSAACATDSKSAAQVKAGFFHPQLPL